MNEQIALIYHWKDLKIKLYFFTFSYCLTLLISFAYKIELFYLLGQVFIQFKKHLIFTQISTGFLIYLKLAIGSSFFFLIPLIFYFLFLFFLKGFLNYQAFYFYCTIMFFFLIYLTMLIINLLYFLPFIFSFFLSFENPEGLIALHLETRFDQYFLFMSEYLLIIIWIILYPFIILSINVTLLKHFYCLRQKLYLPFLISLALLAPPDIILQIIFFIFFCLSAEILIFLFFFIKRISENLFEESRIRTYDE